MLKTYKCENFSTIMKLWMNMTSMMRFVDTKSSKKREFLCTSESCYSNKYAFNFNSLIIDNSHWQLINQTSAQILVFELKRNFDNNLQFQNIYNVKKIIRKKKLNRYTFTQVLLKALHHRDWFVKIRLRKYINEIKRIVKS